MNPHTGAIVPITNVMTLQTAAAELGCDEGDVVVLDGPEEHVRNISAAVKAARRTEAKQARRSRKRNR